MHRFSMRGFLDFIREQGVVGLAVGFILGGAVSKTVASFVNDIINPLLGVAFGAAGSLSSSTLQIGSVSVRWGNFVATALDFLVVALVVYVGVKIIGLDALDKKKGT